MKKENLRIDLFELFELIFEESREQHFERCESFPQFDNNNLNDVMYGDIVNGVENFIEKYGKD